MPLLRHCTPARNLESIQRQGLLTSKATGKRKAVWAWTPARTLWAVVHIAFRHRTPLGTLAVLEVRVPRSWLRRRGGGLFWTPRDVPPGRIVRVIEVPSLAVSPAKG
jgi:hypothetical protein